MGDSGFICTWPHGLLGWKEVTVDCFDDGMVWYCVADLIIWCKFNKPAKVLGGY